MAETMQSSFDKAMQTIRDTVETYQDVELSLLAEIAKLRELCEDMLDCIEIRNAFGRPPTHEMCKEFADRMRELGMEVD